MAHPDDAEFGAAGSVARWVREGGEVTYLVLTNGDKGSDDATMTPERLAAIREAEQRAAAKVLGVKEVVFLGFPDGGLEDNPKAREALVREIRRHRPGTVVVNDPDRNFSAYISHRDHRMAGRIVLDAVLPAGLPLYYPEHRAQGLLSWKVQEVYLSGTDRPNCWVDISDTFHLKLAALRCHESQVGQWPELEVIVRQMCAMMGEPQGLPLAEAFRRLEVPW